MAGDAERNNPRDNNPRDSNPRDGNPRRGYPRREHPPREYSQRERPQRDFTPRDHPRGRADERGGDSSQNYGRRPAGYGARGNFRDRDTPRRPPADPAPRDADYADAKRVRHAGEPKSLVLSNLSEFTTEEDLIEAIQDSAPSSAGCKVVLQVDKHTGLCRGFAFVNCASSDDAAAVCRVLEGSKIKGAHIAASLQRT